MILDPAEQQQKIEAASAQTDYSLRNTNSRLMRTWRAALPIELSTNRNTTPYLAPLSFTSGEQRRG